MGMRCRGANQQAAPESLPREAAEGLRYWEVRAPPVTPMVPKAKLSAEDQPDEIDPAIHGRYRSIVGALG
jgi:hypothetical protein